MCVSNTNPREREIMPTGGDSGDDIGTDSTRSTDGSDIDSDPEWMDNNTEDDVEEVQKELKAILAGLRGDHKKTKKKTKPPAKATAPTTKATAPTTKATAPNTRATAPKTKATTTKATTTKEKK